jgi:prepilin-type N-terminal cleavage/methylation domain-containing protein
MNTQTKQNGFTIIEVVLVLAIAALIFLMVFIALPALQRNQRDAARTTMSSKVAAAITSYQSNKRGVQPPSGVALNGYIDGVAATTNDKFDDGTAAAVTDSLIDSRNYVVRVSTLPTGTPPAGGYVGEADTNGIQVYTGAKCNGAGDAAVSGSKRSAAVLIKKENGNAIVCTEV